MLLCSAGDFYGTADVFNEPKSHFIAELMGVLEYDAIGVGEMELNYGLDALVQDVEDNGLNITCANIVAKGDRKPGEGAAERFNTVFPPYLVAERDDVRFGFVALLSPNTKLRRGRQAGEFEAVEAITYVITDPREKGPEILAEARRSCDILILLAHMDQRELETILPQLPPVDLVVLGHDSRTGGLPEAIQIAETPVVKATSQGQHIGHLEFGVDYDGGLADLDNEVLLLNAEYEDDSGIIALIEDFEAENRKKQKLLFAKEQLKASRNAGASNDVYLGVGACQQCHIEAFEVYTRTGHASAYATLAEQFVHRDSNCVGCHVVGYQEPGGFTGMRYRNTEVDLVDVQCEACHGPGSEHVRDGSYKARAKESCVRCHTPNEDPDFDFATDWPKITH